MTTATSAKPRKKSAPTFSQEELLVQFQEWLKARDLLICRVSFGERKRVDESPENLASQFLSRT